MGERTFIGLELPAATRQTLVTVRRELSASSPQWAEEKWVAEENLHITLKFLGDLSSDRLSEVCGVCDSVTRSLAPFILELAGIAPVRSARTANMLWVTVGEGGDHAARTAALLDEALADLGFPSEARAYRPHVTLVRARKPRRISVDALAAARHVLSESDDRVRRVSVRRVTVYSSTLTPQGPTYRVAHHARLGG